MGEIAELSTDTQEKAIKAIKLDYKGIIITKPVHEDNMYNNIM